MTHLTLPTPPCCAPTLLRPHLALPCPSSGGAGSACGGDEGDNPVDRLLHAMAAVIDDVHGALQGLGGWLRDRVMALGRQLAVKLGLEEEEEEVDERVRGGEQVWTGRGKGFVGVLGMACMEEGMLWTRDDYYLRIT